MLLTPKTHTRFLNSSYSSPEHHGRLERGPYVELDPFDATARGLADGDLVRVWNDRAALTMPVRLTGRVRPGVVAIPWGWWGDDANANALTNDTLTDWGGGVAFWDTLVEVARGPVALTTDPERPSTDRATSTRRAIRRATVDPRRDERTSTRETGGVTLEHVLSPIDINGVTLRNRVVRTAHGTNIGQGRVDDDLIAYHLARGRGGVGLSIVEAASVHRTDTGTLRLHDESCVADFRRLMDAIRPTGMRMFSQLGHLGHDGVPMDPDQQPWSASEVRSPGTGALARAMTVDEIEELTACFARVAGWVREGGARRRRGPCRPRLPAPGVPVAGHQPAHRPLRRVVREPAALHGRGGGRGPRRRRAGLRGRHPDRRGRHRRRGPGRGLRRGGGGPRGHRPHRLRQRHLRQLPRAAQDHRRHARALGLRAAHQRGGHEGGLGAHPRDRPLPHPGRGRRGDPHRAGRPGRHDQGPHRRPRHRAQDDGRSSRRGPAVHRLQPGLRRWARPRPDGLRGQRRCRLRAGARGRLRPGGQPPNGARRRWWPGRHGGRPRRGPARTPGGAVRGHRRAGREHAPRPPVPAPGAHGRHRGVAGGRDRAPGCRGPPVHAGRRGRRRGPGARRGDRRHRRPHRARAGPVVEHRHRLARRAAGGRADRRGRRPLRRL